MVFRCTLDDTATGLDPAARQAYARDGVLVIEDFVAPAACEALRRRALELVAGHGSGTQRTVFSSTDQRHAAAADFEASANGIGVFFEDGAHDESGRLRVPLEQAVNKIGHAMHDLDPVFKAFSTGPRLQAVAQGVGQLDPLLIQSMYIFKPPAIGGEVGCHQDASYIGTEPESVVGFWFAIDAATRDNGCLGALPGAHRRGLREVFRRQADGRLGLQTLQPELSWPTDQVEWLEVPQGSLIALDGSLPHLSPANRSPRTRHAFTLHTVSAGARYRADNWIQRQPGVHPPWRGFGLG